MITVETIGVPRVMGGYRVMFRAHNIGGAVASQVRIEGTLTRAMARTRSATWSWTTFPGILRGRADCSSPQDPHSGVLTLRAAGFAEP